MLQEQTTPEEPSISTSDFSLDAFVSTVYPVVEIYPVLSFEQLPSPSINLTNGVHPVESVQATKLSPRAARITSPNTSMRRNYHSSFQIDYSGSVVIAGTTSGTYVPGDNGWAGHIDTGQTPTIYHVDGDIRTLPSLEASDSTPSVITPDADGEKEIDLPAFENILHRPFEQSLDELVALRKKDDTAAGNQKPPDLKPKRKPTICKCGCKPDCDCQCSCTHHCYCRKDACTSDCKKSFKGRNLIISIDGTSNTFCTTNTNVVELHSRIEKFVGTGEDGIKQLKCYLSGIGTTLPPSQLSVSHWRIKIANAFDFAFAWRFSKIVQDAYRWLMENYQPGDRIFLFGFSRGAYQIRTLAGMINRLGLLESGNRTLIPFAYDFYLNKYQDLRASELASSDEGVTKDAAQKAVDLAEHFKKTFSHSDTVKVHFIGAWDTVSSIGIMRQMPIPLTNTAKHVCFFRHALALDECRVKFIPEYLEDQSERVPESRSQASIPTKTESDENARGKPGPKSGLHIPGRGESAKPNPTFSDPGVETVKQSQPEDPNAPKARPAVKEVWFSGSHSDIGGGYKENVNLENSVIPLLWMENESQAVGLHFKQRTSGATWKPQETSEAPTNSMTPFWWFLEYLPITAWKPLGGIDPPSDWISGIHSRFSWFQFRKATVDDDTRVGVLSLKANQSLQPRLPLISTMQRMNFFGKVFPSSTRITTNFVAKKSLVLAFFHSIWSYIVHIYAIFVTSLLHLPPVEGTTLLPHRGRGRVILDGQFIHASVAFKPSTYTPKANFAVPLDWKDLVGTAKLSDTQPHALSWPQELEHRLDKDLFDETIVDARIAEFLATKNPGLSILQELSFMALAVNGATAIWWNSDLRQRILDGIRDCDEDKDVMRKEYLDCLSRVLRHDSVRGDGSILMALRLLTDLLREPTNSNKAIRHGLLTCLLSLLEHTWIRETEAKDVSVILCNLFEELTESISFHTNRGATSSLNTSLVTRPAYAGVMSLVKRLSASGSRLPTFKNASNNVETDMPESEAECGQNIPNTLLSLTLDCMAAAMNNGFTDLPGHLARELRSTAIRTQRLSILLFKKHVQRPAVRTLSALASFEEGQECILNTMLHDAFLWALDDKDFELVPHALGCLVNYIAHDNARKKIFQPAMQFCKNLLSTRSPLVELRSRFKAAIALRTLVTIDPDPQVSGLDTLCSLLLGIMVDPTQEDGVQLACADALACCIGRLETMQLEKDDINILLTLMSNSSSRDHRSLLTKTLDQCGGQRDDLAMSYSTGEFVDTRMMALGVLSSFSKHASNVPKICENIEQVCSALEAVITFGDMQLLRWTQYWFDRLIGHQNVPEEVSRQLVTFLIVLTEDASRTKSARFWAIRMMQNLPTHHGLKTLVDDLNLKTMVKGIFDENEDLGLRFAASLVLSEFVKAGEDDEELAKMASALDLLLQSSLKPINVVYEYGVKQTDDLWILGTDMLPIHVVVNSLLAIGDKLEPLMNAESTKGILLKLICEVLSSEVIAADAIATVAELVSRWVLHHVKESFESLSQIKRALDSAQAQERNNFHSWFSWCSYQLRRALVEAESAIEELKSSTDEGSHSEDDVESPPSIA